MFGPVLAVVMLCLLAFIGGAWTAWRDGFPFDPFLRRAFIGLTAVWTQYLAPKPVFASDAWMPIDGRETGVLKHDPESAFEGHTLVTFGQQAVLIDMAGRPVHRWSLSYEQIRAATGQAGPDMPETWLYWNNARLYPNGDLVVIVAAWETTPVGVAVIKIDRASNLLWAHPRHVHHDLDRDDAGRLYVLDQQVREARPPQLWGLNEPLLDEHVVVLSREGQELRRVSILDAFADSAYAALINEVAPDNLRRWGDYLHTNNVELVTPALAQQFPFLAPGQVILSMRQLDTIAALDLERKTIVWAARGPWRRQHDPDLLPNGHIVLFDNQGDWVRNGRSRVIEVDPKTNGIVWSYPSADGGELWSAYRGQQQVLPNGNVLINEFLRGRLLEVTRDGEIAWEFVSPFRHRLDQSYVGRIMQAQRYGAPEIPFVTARDGLVHRDPEEEAPQ
ncbi:MAG TPA: arylsulfotransferase family protein [Geminicoccaceae bacterium]|nr:arylsulfotransferase family protein [Geminicoccaceae bacterium]